MNTGGLFVVGGRHCDCRRAAASDDQRGHRQEGELQGEVELRGQNLGVWQLEQTAIAGDDEQAEGQQAPAVGAARAEEKQQHSG